MTATDTGGGGGRAVTGEQFNVDGATAIVTGSSRGIGRAIAERFASEGADVVVSSRDRDHVDPVAAAIDERDGGRALAVECDVRDRDAVEAMVAATATEFGGVDVLVNNAGAAFVAPFEEITPNGWQAILDVNLTGTYHCSQAAGAEMREAGGGRIVNVASVAGIRGSPGATHYAAAKAGVVNLTRSLAAEWAADGVRVNSVAPGFVATPGVASKMGVTADDVDRSDVDRQVGLPEEVADAVQFLASPASSYVVGETLVVKGTPRLETWPDD